jgi:hypothetical protein
MVPGAHIQVRLLRSGTPRQEDEMAKEPTTLLDDEILSGGARAEVLEPDADDVDGDAGDSDGDDTDDTDGDDSDGGDDADGDDAS